MIELLKKFIPKAVAARLMLVLDLHAQKSYSQEGEDMILRRFFENQETGFYVDVGAHHPLRFSNTYYFYKKGWRGINIDAMPGSMYLFRKYRDRDINLEVPVGEEGKLSTYYVFNEPALNGFDERLSLQRNSDFSKYEIMKKLPLTTRSLAAVLEEYLPADQGIDFLSVDVEGLDLEVLQSNDWVKFRPEIVLVESLGNLFGVLGESEIDRYLNNQGYSICAKAMNTLIYKQSV